jgi:hypothetical protein
MRTVYHVLGLLVSLQSTLAYAQLPVPGPLNARPRPLPINGSGEIVAFRPGFLQVKTAAGDWLMKIEAPPEKIVLQGTALASWLRPGMLVRFSTTLDKKGVAQTPIEELFVFTPNPQYRIGVFPDSELLFDEAEQDKGQNLRKRRRAKTEGRYLVAGRLTSLRSGAMRVDAGQNVRAQLAENAKIQVDVLGDYSLVRKGDKVEFVGHYYEKGKGILRDVTITAASPFGTEEASSMDRKNSRPKKSRQQADEGKPPEADKPPETAT